MSLDLATLLRPERETPRGPNNDLTATPTPAPEQSASIQYNAAKRRNKRCELLRLNRVEDETGGSSVTWKQVGGYTIGVEEMGNPSEQTNQAQGNGQSVSPFNLYFDLGVDVIPQDRVGVPGWFNAWRPNHNYNAGDLVIPTQRGGNNHYYVVFSAGKTGLEEPKWKTDEGAPVLDNTLIFKEAGTCEFYEIEGTNRGDTNSAELVAYAKRVE